MNTLSSHIYCSCNNIVNKERKSLFSWLDGQDHPVKQTEYQKEKNAEYHRKMI